MKLHQRSIASAFTLLEVFVVVAIFAVLAAIFLTARPRARSSRVNCTNNLKQIAVAFRTWALDNNDKYPMQVSITNGGTMELVGGGTVFMNFRTMSNELSTPKLLFCPREFDRRRGIANAFNPGTASPAGFHLTNDNQVSYFVGVDANESNPQMLLCGDRNITNGSAIKGGFLSLTTNKPAGWTADFHQFQGNVCLADGSVQGLSSHGLNSALKATGLATNRLAIP